MTGISAFGVLNISLNDFKPGKVYIDINQDSKVFNFNCRDVNVGDNLNNVTAVVSYNFGDFEILLTEDLTSNITSANLQPDSGFQLSSSW